LKIRKHVLLTTNNERYTSTNELIQLMFHKVVSNSENCTGILGQTVQKDGREQGDGWMGPELLMLS